MSSIEKKALGLVGPIYAAALDNQQWPSLIGAISGAVDGQGGMLRLNDYANQRVGFYKTAGYENEFVRAYSDYFISIDPYRNFFAHSPVGKLLQASRHQDYNALQNSEYHNDFNRPQDKEHLVGAALARDGDVAIQFGVQRGRRVGDFREEDLQLLNLLLPHLTQAVQVSRLIGDATTRADMAFASLDQARAGIFLLAANGKVLHINCKGEKLLASGELAVNQNGLAFKDASATARLRQLIALAAQPALGETLMGGGELKLSSSEGKTNLELRVIPMPAQMCMNDFSTQRGCVAVFVSRPGAMRLPWQKVASIYGLSPAEARLAVMIAEGCSPEEAAERFFVSISTVRSQLRAVFAKTGTKRQSELVVMLLGGVLAWCNTEE